MARVKYYDQASQEWKYADAALNMKGKDGYTPVKGADYFTDEDKQELTENIMGQGVLTYNEQSLTEEQKAQARENIGIDQISFDKLNEDLDANGYRIVGLSEPQQPSEPATKGYVDTFAIEANTFVATDDGEGNVTIVPYENDVAEPTFMEHIGNKQNPHGVTAEQVKARPDTWMPTADQVGAATPEAVNSAKTAAVTESKTYTNEQVKKAAPRNLLDNSDFTNPVNQRGQTSYTEQGYTIDRWKTVGALSVTAGSDGITLANTGTSTLRVEQTIPAKLISSGMRYTVAITTENGRFCGSCTLSTDAQTVISESDFYCQIQISSGNAVIQIRQRGGYTTKYKNVALYEGEYTIETLPEYQPKGYAAELLECQRYYYRIRANWKWVASGICTSTTAIAIPIKLPTAMRINPRPNIVDPSKIKIRCGSTASQVPSDVTWNFANDIFDIIQMEATVTGATNGAIAVLYFDNGGIIEFDADVK